MTIRRVTTVVTDVAGDHVSKSQGSPAGDFGAPLGSVLLLLSYSVGLDRWNAIQSQVNTIQCCLIVGARIHYEKQNIEAPKKPQAKDARDSHDPKKMRSVSV